jgi:hypothetical protein
MNLSFEDYESMVSIKDFSYEVIGWNFTYYENKIDYASAKVHDTRGNYPDIWFDIRILNDSIEIHLNERMMSEKSSRDRRDKAYQEILLANPFMLEKAKEVIEDYAFEHNKIKEKVIPAEGCCDEYIDWIWNDEKKKEEKGMNKKRTIKSLCFFKRGTCAVVDVADIWDFIRQHNNDCNEMGFIRATIGEKEFDVYFDGEYALKIADRTLTPRDVTGLNLNDNSYSPFIAGTALICNGDDDTGESESLTDEDIEYIMKETLESFHGKVFTYKY